MEVIFIKEREGLLDGISQVKNGTVDYLERTFNALNSSRTENMVLPIVPQIKFPNVAKIDSYEGLTTNYNLPARRSLDDISWDSFFPVNKNYNFQHVGASSNGYDYVEFLQRRLNNQLPFRMLAYSMNTISNDLVGVVSGVANKQSATSIVGNAFKIHFDGLVIVSDFSYHSDNTKDIQYSLNLKQFVGGNLPLIDWTSLGVSVASNLATKYAMKTVGLI